MHRIYTFRYGTRDASNRRYRYYVVRAATVFNIKGDSNVSSKRGFKLEYVVRKDEPIAHNATVMTPDSVPNGKLAYLCQCCATFLKKLPSNHHLIVIAGGNDLRYCQSQGIQMSMHSIESLFQAEKEGFLNLHVSTLLPSPCGFRYWCNACKRKGHWHSR